MPLLQVSARRVAMGLVPMFPDHDRCHVTQHHHPTCKPLLIGGNGGADDKQHHDKTHREGWWTTARTWWTTTKMRRMATNNGMTMWGWRCKGNEQQCADSNARTTYSNIWTTTQCQQWWTLGNVWCPLLQQTQDGRLVFFFLSFSFVFQLATPLLWAPACRVM